MEFQLLQLVWLLNFSKTFNLSIESNCPSLIEVVCMYLTCSFFHLLSNLLVGSSELKVTPSLDCSPELSHFDLSRDKIKKPQLVACQVSLSVYVVPSSLALAISISAGPGTQRFRTFFLFFPNLHCHFE
ncbi:hypothetical protein B0H63DRAFT_261834 [Podospora didyma]|uniref:Uncharacterized protein n=1 Tax=Podospora didyma TaxID=330526 RepID=A0AAE0KEY5_9PEZI|nr:hypothetical protein B0H63DRAFT_261834 [Podospora didyma]